MSNKMAIEMFSESESLYFLLLFSQVIKVDHDAHGVDTPEDVEKIESLMRERNLP